MPNFSVITSLQVQYQCHKYAAGVHAFFVYFYTTVYTWFDDCGLAWNISQNFPENEEQNHQLMPENKRR